MDLHLTGRTALVTGGARGIGLGVAKLLAAEGCHLHLASRNAANLDAAQRDIVAAYGVKVATHTLDLSLTGNVLKLARLVGNVDILVNNAGAIPHGPITGLGDSEWRDGWELKVFGYIALTREIYREMCAMQRGVIINVVGTAGERPSAGYIAGAMGNAALMAMSRALGAESIFHGVRVVAVNPGGIETERPVAQLKTQAARKLGDEQRWRELLADRPMKRMGSGDEVAATIVFLCSDRCAYTSGTVVTVDAGASARKR